MRNDLEQMLAEHGAFWFIIIGVVVVKWLWSEAKQTWKDWLRHITVAILVGWILNAYLSDVPAENLGDGAKGAILGLIVLQADYLFVGLMRVGASFRDNPAGTLRIVLDIWKGRK